MVGAVRGHQLRAEPGGQNDDETRGRDARADLMPAGQHQHGAAAAYLRQHADHQLRGARGDWPDCAGQCPPHRELAGEQPHGQPDLSEDSDF